MAVTEETTIGRLIRESLHIALDRGEELAMHAYDEILRSAPEVKPLFLQTDMAVQRQRLLEALQFIALNFERRPILERMLGELGRRHASYGVHSHHYAVFGESFLRALAKACGPGWNRSMDLAWRTAYEDIADMMLRGVSEVA